jgi:hypothetical protein
VVRPSADRAALGKPETPACSRRLAASPHSGAASERLSGSGAWVVSDELVDRGAAPAVRPPRERSRPDSAVKSTR